MTEFTERSNQSETINQEQAYARQFRALTQSVNEKQDALPYCPKISTDETGSVHIRWLHHETYGAGLFGSSYLDEVVVSSQNKIRVANTEVGQWAPLAGQIRGPLYEGGDLNKVNINNLKSETNDFSGSPRDQKIVKRIITLLQEALVEKLALDDGNLKYDLRGYRISPFDKLEYFAAACRIYPEAMRGVRMPLAANREDAFKTAVQLGLLASIPKPTLIDRLQRKNRVVILKNGLEIHPVGEKQADIYFPKTTLDGHTIHN